MEFRASSTASVADTGVATGVGVGSSLEQPTIAKSNSVASEMKIVAGSVWRVRMNMFEILTPDRSSRYMEPVLNCTSFGLSKDRCNRA